MGAQNSSTAADAAAAPNKPAVAREPEDIELKIKQVKRLNPTSASPRVRLMQAKEIDRICRQNSGDFSTGPTAAQDNLHTLRSAKSDSQDIDQTKSKNQTLQDTEESNVKTHYDSSRREAALGKEALQALRSLNVLVLGCRGAGIETAKNVVLLGPNSVCIWDPSPTKLEDLGCNFYLRKEHVRSRTPRAKACEKELVELNPFCKVSTRVDSYEVILQDIRAKKYSTVIVTDLLCLTAKQLRQVSTETHNLGVAFMMALTAGVTATIFSDFGESHTITDPDGMPTNVCAVAALELLPLHKDDEKGWLKPEINFKEGRKAVYITVSSESKKTLKNGKALVCCPTHFPANRTQVPTSHSQVLLCQLTIGTRTHHSN